MSNNIKLYPTWEILGLVIGFVGSANLVPELVNLILNLYAKPDDFTRTFKIISIGIYFLLLVILASRHLYKIQLPHEEGKEDDIVVITNGYKRIRVLNFIRQFPISLINNLVFKLYRVLTYDLFKRHAEWGERPELFNLIGRFRLEGKTIEIQLPRSFENLHVRETLPNSDKFGNTQFLNWSKFTYRFLVTTTWLGLAWSINHILIKCQALYRTRQILAICYFVGFLLHALDLANARLNFSEMDVIWKSWIIFLLVFDLLASIGLYRQKIWGDVLFLLIAIAQLIAYVKFSSFFGDQTFLIYFHIICLLIYGIFKAFDFWRQSETKL